MTPSLTLVAADELVAENKVTEGGRGRSTGGIQTPFFLKTFRQNPPPCPRHRHRRRRRRLYVLVLVVLTSLGLSLSGLVRAVVLVVLVVVVQELVTYSRILWLVLIHVLWVLAHLHSQLQPCS